MPRESYGQLSTGIIIPEQYIRNGFTSPFSAHPGFNDGGNMFCCPSDGQWPAADQDNNGGCPRSLHGLDQVCLVPCQVKVCSIVTFSVGSFILPYNNDGDIGPGCCRCWQPGSHSMHCPAHCIP